MAADGKVAIVAWHTLSRQGNYGLTYLVTPAPSSLGGTQADQRTEISAIGGECLAEQGHAHRTLALALAGVNNRS
jgi:hypothetical protein